MIDVPQAVWRAARAAGAAPIGRALARHWPFPVRATLKGGRQMFVDLRSAIGRGLFATGEFDVEAIRPALERLRPGGTYVDIGANVGAYAMLALDVVGAAGCIHCFEIDQRPLSVLRKTIKTFSIQNIKVYECAVSDRDGEICFEPGADHGQTRINRSGQHGRTVPSIRLDTWAEQMQLSRLDVIKIDVEGAERFVLQGAQETISSFRPLILCEAEEENTGRFGYQSKDLITAFDTLQYSATWLQGVHTPTLLARPRV